MSEETPKLFPAFVDLILNRFIQFIDDFIHFSTQELETLVVNSILVPTATLRMKMTEIFIYGDDSILKQWLCFLKQSNENSKLKIIQLNLRHQ